MAGVMALQEIKTDNLTPFMDRHNMLIYHENHIRKELSTIQESCIYIGYHLLDIAENEFFDTVYYQARADYCKNIYEYAFQELDLSKTTTCNLMTVAKLFSNDRRGIKEEYRDYSFSQLVELASVPAELHRYASPLLSVKKLREWKRGYSVWGVGSNGICKSFQIPVSEMSLLLVPTSEQSAREAKCIDAECMEVVPTSECAAQEVEFAGAEIVPTSEQSAPEAKSIDAECTEVVPTSEQSGKTVGCVVCRTHKYGAPFKIRDDNGKLFAVSYISFCPYCGRRLRDNF